VLNLALWTAAAVVTEAVAVRMRRGWSAQRLTLTHDLVELMVGHRTRRVCDGTQPLRGDEHRALRSYADGSRRYDRIEVALVP
jgi:hypothetical protein